jgi:uncharacterized phage protein (TIGR02218 family)
MKAASAGLISHIQGESQTLTTLWRVVRRDGTVFTFTDHDRDVVYGGDTYTASIGYQRSAIASSSNLAVDEGELLGMLDSASITPAELRAGLWDGAEVRIFAVNWSNLAHGEIKLRRGTLGEVVAKDDGSFRAELRGLAQPLSVTIGSVYQPECRADLGDARCKIDLDHGAGWTQEAEISTVTDSTTIIMDSSLSSFVDGWFEAGVVIWQDGTNAGVVREVLSWVQSTRTLTLFSPPPFTPTAGDTLHVQPGCDKKWATCRTKFSNRLNFRGEPTVPGAKTLLETPIRV